MKEYEKKLQTNLLSKDNDTIVLDTNTNNKMTFIISTQYYFSANPLPLSHFFIPCIQSNLPSTIRTPIPFYLFGPNDENAHYAKSIKFSPNSTWRLLPGKYFYDKRFNTAADVELLNKFTPGIMPVSEQDGEYRLYFINESIPPAPFVPSDGWGDGIFLAVVTIHCNQVDYRTFLNTLKVEKLKLSFLDYTSQYYYGVLYPQTQALIDKNDLEQFKEPMNIIKVSKKTTCTTFTPIVFVKQNQYNVYYARIPINETMNKFFVISSTELFGDESLSAIPVITMTLFFK